MSSDAVQQVRACLKDEDHYKKGRKKIIQQIDNGNRLYTTALVDTVKAVLKDKKEPGVSKFIALYFLKEAMDTKDPELVNYVKEKTLSRLSEIAKSDSSKIFPSKTEDKILRNFDQLLLECIVFWAEWFGSEKGGSKYKSTLAEVKQKVELPKKYSFFVTKKKKEEAPPDSGKPAVQESTKKEESKQASSKPGKKEPIVNKIQELLSTQEGNKEMLMESIAGNNKPDINVLQIVNDQFIDIDKELQEAVNVLFPMEFPEKEGILNRVLEETSFTSKYLNDFKRLQKKQMSLDEFKSSILVAIGGTKGQNKGKEAPKKADAPKPAASKKDFDVDFNQGQNTGNLYGGQQNAFGGFETAPAPGRGSNAFENFGGSSASRPSQVNQDFNNFGGQQNAFGNFDSAPPSANQQQGGGFGAFDDPRQVNQGNNAFGNFENPQQQNFGDFNNFGGGNQRQGRPNVVPPPNDFNQQQNFNDNSASAGNRRRSKDTPFDHDQGFDNHNQGFNNQGGNQGFNNNQGFDNRGQGAFDTPFDQDQGHHDNRGHGGSQAFDHSNQGRGGAQDFSEFGSGWDPNPNQGFDQNQGFNEKVKGAGNKGHENNQGFDQHNQGHGDGNQDFGFDQNQGFNDNRGGRGGNQGFDNNQSRGGNNQGFDQGWDNNNQGFDNNQQGFSDNRDNRDNRRNQNANQGFDNSQGWDNSNQGFDNSQGFNENRRGAGNKQSENNQGFDNSQQGFGDNRRNQNANQGFDNSNQGWDNNNQGFNSNQGHGGNNQGFDQGWDNNNQGFDQNQGFNDNRGGRGGNQGFDSNQGRGGNNQGFDQGWDNNNQGFNSNQGRGGNNQGFDQGWDNNNQGFDNNHENGQVPFQNTPVIEVSESLRGIRGKPKEEKKPAANNFDDMWDSGNLEVPPPQKNDGGIGFDDFGDFNSATHGGSAFDSYNNNQQQQFQQQQQASRKQSQGQPQGNQRSEFGDAFEWGAPPPERKPYQSPPTGSFNNEFNNDFNNDYRQQQQQQQQSQSQYQQDQRYPQEQNNNQFEAPKRFDSFGGESQQIPQRFGNETRFDNFNKPEVRSQNYGSDNKSPSMSNLNQNFAPPPSNFNNEPRRDFPQRHDFTQDLTGGYGSNQFKNERPPIRNEVTPPTMYSQSMGGVSNSGFNMGRSMDTHSNYNMLSTNTLVAQNTIPAKMGDMESERLRRERDKILSELDNVKRLYNGLKVEHDHMKMSNNVVSGDFNTLKYEVDDLKRTQGELAMNSQQLRMENEGFRHQRGAMTSENAGHMRLFEEMSREIAQLKGKLTDHDFNDRRRKNEAHVMNLETSLKNAQFQVDSMQTLHHRVANEYNKANSELDKLKLGHYVPPQTNLPSNLIPQIQATAQSIGRPSFSPPRARSRSPGMDLMNIIGDPMPSYSNPTRTSVVNSVVGLRYSPTRSDVDRRMDYASGNVLYSSPPRAEPEVVNTRMSPPRLPEGLYGPNVDRTIPPLFSKYTNQGQPQANQHTNQPIGLHDIQIQQIQAPLYDLSRLPPIPDKYTRTSVTPMYPAEQGYTFQAPTGPLGAITAIGGREGNLAKSTLINPNPVATTTNPANRKASDLIEKAKRLRESASRGGDSFRESVNVRTSIPANEGRYHAGNPSSVYQTAAKTSPKRYSPGRGNFGSGLNMDDLRRGDTTNYKQSIMNRSPPSLMVSHTKMGGLPQGLYRGSPVRERIVNREEVIELKPTESLKIVERPVRSSPNRGRGKSPGQVSKVKSDENIAIGQNAVSLAQTLKNDIQMFKRGMRGSPEAATINPNKNNHYEQEGGLIANKYQYNKGASVESTLQGVTISANDFGGLGRRNEVLSDNEEAKIRQVSGVPGVKLTVGDNYFQGATTTPKKYFQEPIPVRESGLEGVTQYNVAGKKVRGKQGKMMIYDHGMFDQFTNLIYGYTHYRDVDAYKSACLTSRATLFDSPNLQITVITKNENDEVLKAIVHFTNKSNNDISEFSSYPMDTSVQSNPIVQGATIAPKYQLKQELYIHFMDFREMPYTLDISYKHENSSKQMNLALPITINKFMKFRHGVERNTFKGAWKQLKTRAVTTGYRNINAKFVRNPVEIKKYFDNNLLDVTPHLNPKHKKKYGGIFVLPDNREYYVKFTMDTSRIKILASSGRDEPGYEEWVAQYLSFLLTV